jgi:hypothetical protein
MNDTHRFHIPLLCLAIGVFVACNEAPVDEESVDAMMSALDATTVSSASEMGASQEPDSIVTDSAPSQTDQAMNSPDASASDREVSTEADQFMGSGLACERTNDCPFPEVCNESMCDPSTACQSDGDCDLGFLCNRERNRCVIACRTQSNCPQDRVCIDLNCVEGTRCTSDRECEVGEVCETDGTGGFCTNRTVDPLGDMGVAPDGGIWSCNDTLCEPRQRCGPHPSINCDVTECLSAHGGNCDTNCDCVPGLICKQTSQVCVSCLNGLQCDSPERCISTGQCGLNVELNADQPSELTVLQTLAQCEANLSNEACARFSWTGTAPELPRLKTIGCDDALYASSMQDRGVIQDLLRCGGSQSPLIIDPSYDAADNSVCATQRSGYFIFHGCNPNQVPID